MSQKIFNNRFVIVFLAPFLLGSSTVLSLQPYNYLFVNFLILPILFLLITYVVKKSKFVYRKKPFLINLFFIGYLFGIGFFLSGTYWISYSLTFDPIFENLIFLPIIIIPLLLGIFFGVGTALVGPFLKNNFSSILLFCSSLSLIDYLRSKILPGFPWNLWAYSWSNFIESIQLLNLIGLFSFNLLALISFCLPLFIFFEKKFKNLLIFLICILALFANYIYGSIAINENKKFYETRLKKNDNLVNFKIISPNFDLKYNLSSNELDDIIKKLVKYSEPDKSQKTIFIWPEGVFSGYTFSELLTFKKEIEENFSNKHTIILGVNTFNKKENKFFNSMLAINHDSEILHQYDKIKLVPFGEFMPFVKIIEKIGLKKITEGYGSFSKGNSSKNMILENLNILPLICYEIIFPEFIQSLDTKTNLIINISEDAWFGGSIGPHQHFAKAIFRAVESNTILIRAANKGKSAFISNKGRVIESLSLNQAGNIELKIPIINNNSKNKNDLIFFLLLFTYVLIFFTLRNKL